RFASSNAAGFGTSLNRAESKRANPSIILTGSRGTVNRRRTRLRRPGAAAKPFLVYVSRSGGYTLGRAARPVSRSPPGVEPLHRAGHPFAGPHPRGVGPRGDHGLHQGPFVPTEGSQDE